jgi:hypothetical protein
MSRCGICHRDWCACDERMEEYAYWEAEKAKEESWHAAEAARLHLDPRTGKPLERDTLDENLARERMEELEQSRRDMVTE